MTESLVQSREQTKLLAQISQKLDDADKTRREQQHEKRISALENDRSKLIGISAASGGIMSAIGSWIMRHMF